MDDFPGNVLHPYPRQPHGWQKHLQFKFNQVFCSFRVMFFPVNHHLVLCCLFSDIYTRLLCSLWQLKGNLAFYPHIHWRANVEWWNMHGSNNVKFWKESEQNKNVGRQQQEEVVLFLNCPSAWRISQSQSFRQQADKHSDMLSSFLCLHLPSCYSLWVASICFLCAVLHPHSLFLFPLAQALRPLLLPCWIFGEFEETCLCRRVCANVQLLCALCCIHMLSLTLRVQRLVTTDLVHLPFFFFFVRLVFCYVT